MRITIAEVIEQAAQIENEAGIYSKHDLAEAIRALKWQYEGCIVAEGSAAIMLFQGDDDVNQIIAAGSHPSIVEMLDAKPLYRAREAKS